MFSFGIPTAAEPPNDLIILPAKLLLGIFGSQWTEANYSVAGQRWSLYHHGRLPTHCVRCVDRRDDHGTEAEPTGTYRLKSVVKVGP